MRLREGYVIQDQVVVESLLARGRHVSTWGAQTLADGAGPCVVVTATYESGMSHQDVLAARARVRERWECLRMLHRAAVTAIPMPLALLHQYNPDAAVRPLFVQDAHERTREPYLVCSRLRGTPLPQAIAQGEHDEDQALALCLRLVQLVVNCARAGYRFQRFDADDLWLTPSGTGVVLVDVGALVPAEAASQAQCEHLTVPAGVGRLLLGLLTGTPAPAWPIGPHTLDRWRELLAQRRIVGGTHDVVMGLLGDPSALQPTCGVVMRRLQGRLGWRPVGFRAPVRRSTDLAAPASPGHRVAGRYRVVRLLAQGARGFVYLAVDESTLVEVVLKCGKYQYDAASAFALELPTRRAELVHEAEMLRRFCSRCGTIPQPVGVVYDDGVGAWFSLVPQLAPGEPWLVMRPLPGRSLIDAVPDPQHDGRRGPATPEQLPRVAQVLRWVAEVARTLQVMHEAGYLFQDLKPDNLLYDEFTDTLWLVDLASVCPMRPDGTLDRGSVAFGVQTHGYAAPEFATLWERVDARFDIYSLGACAWFWLTGINPERVALSSGNEYPSLDLDALRDVPEVAAEVVRRCLAPREERFGSMADVAAAVARASLALSRSRPLEVRDLQVVYVQEGPQLVWERPDDPRIVGVRVSAVTEQGEAVHYAGAWRDALPVHAASNALAWRVQTVRQRGGELLHSLGRAVRVDPTPPVTRLVVAPDFGGVRVDVSLPAHATGVVVRADRAGPPGSIDEGAAVPVEGGPGGVWARVAADPDQPVFVAAFAQYGAAPPRWSAVRVQSCLPLPRLPEGVRLAAVQSATGVELSWGVALPGAFVEAHAPSGTKRRLVLPVGARTVVDPEAAAGETITYQLRAQVEDILSAPCASLEVMRWPLPPAVTLAEGFGRVTVSVGGDTTAEALDGWMDACVVLGERNVWWPDAGVPFEASLAPAPLTLAVEGDVPQVGAAHVVRADLGLSVDLIRDEIRRGTRALEAVGRPHPLTFCVPAADLGVVLAWASAEWPVALLLDWPGGAPAWSGHWLVQLCVDARAPDAARGDTHVLFDAVVVGHQIAAALADAAGAPCLPLVAIPPGHVASAVLTIRAPDGETRQWRTADLLVEETLPAPTVTPWLGAVEVCAVAPADVVPPPPWYEVEVVLDETSQFYRCEADEALRIEAPPGATVRVRVRRGGTQVPMPWSPPTTVEVLREPQAPARAMVWQGAWGWCLSWEAVPDTDVSYAVRRGANTLVYEGVSTAAWDFDGQADAAWSVVAVRRGVASAPTLFEVVAAPTSTADVWASDGAAPAPVVASRAAPTFAGQLLRVVRVQDLCIAEVHWRGGIGCELVAYDDAGRVVGRALSQGTRVLLIWEAAANVPWVAAGDAADAPRVAVPAPVAGGLLAACVPREGRIVLADVRRGAGVLDEISLVSLGDDVRPVSLTQRETLRLGRMGRRGVLAGLVANAVDGPLSVAPDGPPRILVAAVSVEGIPDAWRWAWRDVFAAWQARRSRALEHQERAALVRVGVGAEGRVDLVADGLHVHVQLQSQSLRRSGRMQARIRWTSRAAIREWSESVDLLGGRW